jgi:hypothetical protein
MSTSRNVHLEPADSHSGSIGEVTANIGENHNETKSRNFFRRNSSNFRLERRDYNTNSNRKHSLEIGEDCEEGGIMERPPALTRQQISEMHSEPGKPSHAPRLPSPCENKPPRNQRTSEISALEMAHFLETKHLRDAELIEYDLLGETADEEEAAECSAFSLKVSSETSEF